MIPEKVRLLLDEQVRALLRAPDFERHREDYVGRVNGMRTMVSALEAAGLLVSPEHDALVEARDGLVRAGTDLAVEHLGYADMSVRVLVERITDAALAARQPAPVDEGLVEQMADDIFDVHPSPSLGAEIARHLLGKGWTRQPAPTVSAEDVDAACYPHQDPNGPDLRGPVVAALATLGIEVPRG